MESGITWYDVPGAVPDAAQHDLASWTVMKVLPNIGHVLLQVFSTNFVLAGQQAAALSTPVSVASGICAGVQIRACYSPYRAAQPGRPARRSHD